MVLWLARHRILGTLLSLAMVAGFSAMYLPDNPVFCSHWSDSSSSNPLLSRENWLHDSREDENFSVDVKEFGAIGDGVADDTISIQRAINFAASKKVKCIISSGSYNITMAINTPTNAWIEWEKDAWLRPTAHSRSGAIITNVDDTPKKRSNIRLDNPQIDGSLLPYIGKISSNDNGIGFAHGVSKVQITGGHIKGFIANFDNGPGGKGLGFEEGVEDVVVDGTLIENCTYATFISPTLDDPDKFVRGVVFKRIHVKRCAAAVWALADPGTAKEPTDDPVRCNAEWIDCTAESCGHMPDLKAPAGRFEKSGVIVVHGASNLYIDFRIVNPSGYPSVSNPAEGTRYRDRYPDAGTKLIGSGLSGCIGSVFKGWGRNIYLKVEYNGDCDDIFNITFPREHKGRSFAGLIQPCAVTGLNFQAVNRGFFRTIIASGAIDSATGLLRSATKTTVTLAANASDRNSEYSGQKIVLTEENGSIQAKRIIAYDGAAKAATVDSAFTKIPDNTSRYLISGKITTVADKQIDGIIRIVCGIPSEGLVNHSARNLTHLFMDVSLPSGRNIQGSLYDIYKNYNVTPENIRP